MLSTELSISRDSNLVLNSNTGNVFEWTVPLRFEVSSLVLCAGQHSVPQYSDVYFRLRQNALVQTAGIGRRPNSRNKATWTLELRHHRHSQTLDSPSKYSQMHREQGCAYNVKVKKNTTRNNHESLQRQHNGFSKCKQREGSYLHQRYSLSGIYALLVNENQNPDDGTNKAETPHETGHDQRRVYGHGHQLAAALSVVVPVFTHRASERCEKNCIG